MISYILGASWLQLILLSVTPGACALVMQKAKSEHIFTLTLVVALHYSVVASAILFALNTPQGVDVPSIAFLHWVCWWVLASLVNYVLITSCRDGLRQRATRHDA